jgi:parallel beta-helix repeat protein
MRSILVIVFFSLCSVLSATKYYISSDGDDKNDGKSELTAWKTIEKVNSYFQIFNSGDEILFRRGDTFYGTIYITKSGSSGNNIIIGAYGDGSDPVITGLETLESWTNETGGIWSKSIECESIPKYILINNFGYAMGRYPNNSFLFYETFNTNLSISDNQLTSNTDWTGAEAVIRKNDWTMDRCIITKHSGPDLHYTSLGSASNATRNNGYFFQNDLRTLDNFGEWYYDGAKIYVYFGSEKPDNYIIKIPTIDNLIHNHTYDYLTIENISFIGSGSSAISFENYTDYYTIRNCHFVFSGENAIKLIVARYGNIENNQMLNSVRCGIFLDSGTDNNIINNTVINSGFLPGADYTGTYCVGINSNYSDNTIIQYNKIDSSAYNGMSFRGNNVLVKNNFINNSCLYLNDGAGIYSTGNKFTNRIIEGNIILNSFGNTSGTYNQTSYAEGIYLDAPSQDIIVKNNTIAFCTRSGIFFHESHDNTCTGNICFDNSQQIRFQYGGVHPEDPIRNIILNNNILLAKSNNKIALWAGSSLEDIPAFLKSDNNYYARPVDDDDVFNTYTPSTGSKYRTLAGWQALTGQDLNSKKSPVAVKDTADIKFYYNASKKDTVINLVQPMLDVKGKSYVNSVTLAPFSSIILMVDPDPPVPVVPVYVSSLINNFSPTKVELTYSVNLDPSSLPLPSDFTVMVNGIARNVISVEITGNKVILILASPVLFGDMVSVSYTQNPGRPLQTSSLGLAANLTDETVKNNIADPSVQNSPPAISVSYEEDVFSGFVCEIDASATIDADNDDLTFSWKIPPDIPVSSITGPVIRFLTPIVSTPQTLTFQLSVNDGKAESSTSLSVNNKPYNPELRMGNVKIIEASNFFHPHHPINVDDNNLNTRWSVEGDNQWITISLADPLKINHIQVALMPDQHYESYFDLFASVDNIFWEPLLQNGVSCGFSGYPQNFNLPADKLNTEYSYVKLLAHGNELDTWNNYSEIKIFGSPGASRNRPDDPENISIYPNPARDHINVMVLEPVTETQTLRVADMAGNVRFETIIDPGTYNTQIPVNLTSGVYIVQVLLGNFIRFAQTLIITR